MTARASSHRWQPGLPMSRMRAARRCRSAGRGRAPRQRMAWRRHVVTRRYVQFPCDGGAGASGCGAGLLTNGRYRRNCPVRRFPYPETPTSQRREPDSRCFVLPAGRPASGCRRPGDAVTPAAGCRHRAVDHGMGAATADFLDSLRVCSASPGTPAPCPAVAAATSGGRRRGPGSGRARHPRTSSGSRPWSSWPSAATPRRSGCSTSATSTSSTATSTCAWGASSSPRTSPPRRSCARCAGWTPSPGRAATSRRGSSPSPAT